MTLKKNLKRTKMKCRYEPVESFIFDISRMGLKLPWTRKTELELLDKLALSPLASLEIRICVNIDNILLVIILLGLVEQKLFH